MEEYNSEQVAETSYDNNSGKVPVLDSIDSDGIYSDLQFIEDYSVDEALVAVHGFNPDEDKHPEARPPSEVWNDRFLKASEIACKLHEENSLDRIVISGGGSFEDGKTEAEIMYNWAREEGHPIMVFGDYVEKEENSENTDENVQNIYEIADEYEIRDIIPVSNFDHIGRVSNIFESSAEDHLGEQENEILEYPREQKHRVFPVASDESYRKASHLLSEDFPGSGDEIDYHLEDIRNKAV